MIFRRFQELTRLLECEEADLGFRGVRWVYKLGHVSRHQSIFNGDLQ